MKLNLKWSIEMYIKHIGRALCCNFLFSMKKWKNHCWTKTLATCIWHVKNIIIRIIFSESWINLRVSLVRSNIFILCKHTYNTGKFPYVFTISPICHPQNIESWFFSFLDSSLCLPQKPKKERFTWDPLSNFIPLPFKPLLLLLYVFQTKLHFSSFFKALRANTSKVIQTQIFVPAAKS